MTDPLTATSAESALPSGWRAYTDRRIWPLGLRGFASGLPLLLTGGTLSAWLKESGIDKGKIGLFAWVGTLYAFKVLWAPLVDQMPIPGLTRALGQRRAWLVVSQLGLAAGLFAMSQTQPAVHVQWTALAAVVVAFFSATLDVAVDAFRVERAGPGRQGEAAAAAIFGYRIGMLSSSAGALYLAEYLDWPTAYRIMAVLVAVGLATTLACSEPLRPETEKAHGATVVERWISRLQIAVFQPLQDFTRHRGWAAILAFAMTFKLGDALAAVMTNPFLLEVGFTKPEIANATKIFGLVATLAGAAVGAELVRRYGMVRSLWIGGVLQVLSLAVFAVQAQIGRNVAALSLTIGFEYAASAVGTAAFTAYLSSLCSARYTATQYALLTSLAAIGRSTLASSAGVVAQETGWFVFFLLTALAAMPGLGLLAWLQVNNRKQPQPA